MKLLKPSVKISSLARRTFLRKLIRVSVGTSIFQMFGIGNLPTAIAQSTRSETTLVTVVQQFGWDSTNAADKILIQFRNGEQYFVWYDWYDNSIVPSIGSAISLTYEGSGSSRYLYTLINTGTGKETRILRFARAN